MKKTLVALAALAATASFAQSSVSITGYFGGSYDQFKISSNNAARTGNQTESRVSDQSSRILFNVNEDLGGGLSAIAQYDLRFKVDAAARIQDEANNTAGNQAVDPVTNGNIHIGLRSKEWGTFKLGRQDIHYTEQAISILPGGLYLAANQAPVVYRVSGFTVANWSRTPNLMWFESNRSGGFQASLGYSTNPLRSSATNEVENGIGSSATQKSGFGTWVKLNYLNGPLDLTYSVYNASSDYVGGAAYGTNTGATGASINPQADQYSQTILAKYEITPAVRAALGYTRNTMTAVAAGAAANTAYSFVPANYAVGDKLTANATHAALAYKVGSGTYGIAYAKRSNTTFGGVEADNSGLKQVTLSYTYDLSKNTAVGVMYTAQTAQDNLASPGLFYQGNNAYGGQVANMRGEKQSITSVALRTNF